VARHRASLSAAAGFAAARPLAAAFWLLTVFAGLLSGGVALILSLLRHPRGGLRAASQPAVAVMAPWVLRWRIGAWSERAAVERYTRAPIAQAYLPPAEGGRAAVAAELLEDPVTWLDAAYFLVAPIPAGLALLAIGTLWALALDLLFGQSSDPWMLALTSSPAGRLIPWAALVVLLLLPVIGLVLSGVQVGLARALLGPPENARLAEEAASQRELRRLAVDAAEAERRRIERDLHDGAQQRLTALALDLGMARQKMATDPAAAGQLVERAHADAKLALAELRDLARGIHPTLLTDRGLGSAVTALAARAPVAVEVDADLPHRLPAPLESAAYFLVAEALTNVSRHAEASAAEVWIALRNGCLIAEVRDDGRGGADPAGGTGLRGLADRIAGLDGHMVVDSPAGGPTVVRAEIPCGW
jgi:signal transduction histidine kinase